VSTDFRGQANAQNLEKDTTTTLVVKPTKQNITNPNTTGKNAEIVRLDAMTEPWSFHLACMKTIKHTSSTPQTETKPAKHTTSQQKTLLLKNMHH
jgi:hypothetical protein